MQGWIKIKRKIKKWEWYKNAVVKSLFLHLVIEANHKDGRWEGEEIKRGQLAVGRHELSKDTGLSEQQVRTALDKLKQTKEILVKSTNKYSIVTICKYDEYQSSEDDVNQQITNNQPTNNQRPTSSQPADNQQITTNKNNNNSNNENNEENDNNPVELYPTFNDFWNAYDHKQDRARCEKLWKKIEQSEKEKMMAHVDVYVASTPDKKFRKHPATYLYNKSWENEVIENGSRNRDSKNDRSAFVNNELAIIAAHVAGNK
jgi:hypothetical protein